MTESEWLVCSDPGAMLRILRRKASDRKARWFNVACLRHKRVWPKKVEWQGFIQCYEDLADGLIEWEEFLMSLPPEFEGMNNDREDVLRTAVQWAASEQWTEEWRVPRWLKRIFGSRQPSTTDQSHLIRDLFGNPFRKVVLDPAWLTSTVVALANEVYDHRILPAGNFDTARLIILADALEEAGCDNADILTHLRGPGPHVRGCWPVDLLLGKS